MPATIDLGLTDKETQDSPATITDSEDEPVEGDKIPETSVHTHEATQQESTPDNHPVMFDVEDVLGPGETISEDTHPEFSLVQQELLHWHYRLNHLSFTKIQEMAKQRLLPSRLAKCTVPLCSGCIYGKMTRRPWRTKAPYSTVPKIATAPGQCVSVDQLDATVPGLIAQLKGIPTTRRYNYATVFVDHYSKLSYIHLQQTLTSEDTVNAKKAFENYATTYGVTILHYHADNGRFADNAFRQHLKDNNQTITFCGVNAHWQNGVAEKRIRDLTENARAILLFAQRRWPDAITPNLWPYALRMANMVHNHVPLRGRRESPLELFSSTTILPQLRHFHHFGCPTYVLQGPLQQGQKVRKWGNRARIGIYLGPSPQHAKSVALVLSLTTGNVSPQYHVQFDDLFNTRCLRSTASTRATRSESYSRA